MTDAAFPPPFSDGLSRGTPGAHGVDAHAVADFLEEVADAGLDLHALMLHRRGHVVAEGWRWPYRADRPRMLHSATKSFAAAGVGLAIAEGRVRLADKVVSFFPDELPPVVDEQLAAMTVEDLLTMRTGHAAEVSGSIWRGIRTSWIAEFFRIPLAHRPGTTYVYSSAASYMLSAIVTRTTGQTLHDYLKPRLFAPLGIRGETWDLGPDGVNPGGNGLTATTADLLKLGLLHAAGGVWEGRQVLPADWVAASTQPQGDPGYGYHWVTGRPRGAYSAIGVFVQMVSVYASHGATLAVTAGIDGTHRLVPLLNRHFPKAFVDAPADAARGEARLAALLARWTETPALSAQAAAIQQRVNGANYAVEPNAAGVTGLRLGFADGTCTFTLTDAEGAHHVRCGLGGWVEGTTTLPGRELHHGYRLAGATVVAGAEWTDARTLTLHWVFAETAFRDTVVCRFDGDRMTLDRSVNVNTGPLTQPQLTAQALR